MNKLFLHEIRIPEISIHAVSIPFIGMESDKKLHPTPEGLYLIDADGYQLVDSEGFMLTVKS